MLQLRAIIAECPIATASAPGPALWRHHRRFGFPPAYTKEMSPDLPTSSSARRAWQNGRDTRDAGFLGGEVGSGARAAFHTIDIDGIWIGFGCHPHVVIDPGGAQLELNRNLPIGGFTNLLNLERKVIGTKPVQDGVLVNADRCRPAKNVSRQPDR